MAYSVTLSDGTKLDNLALNGNNFISSVKVTEEDFTQDKLSKVTITDDDGKSTDYTDMVLVQLTQMGDETWFILGEKAQDDVSKLLAAVATLTDMTMALSMSAASASTTATTTTTTSTEATK